MEWNITSSEKITINLLVSFIDRTDKGSVKKASKIIFIGNNISLTPSTTNANY